MSDSINKTRKYFGTDGVRDIANEGNMTPEFALALGRAYVLFNKERGVKRPHIAVGRDTRFSGPMIQAALTAGINSAGGDVSDLGVIPTPGVSYAVANNNFDGGAVISASHNPSEYNGIKFLDGSGFKLTDSQELSIEEKIFAQNDGNRPISSCLGTVTNGQHLSDGYLNSLLALVDEIGKKDYPITADGANGAASHLLEPLFKNWGGKVNIVGNTPDGININNGVGVTHMNYLCTETVKSSSLLGIAYDGDTDRVLMCDSKGRVLDGDIMLWVIGRWLAKHGKLGSGVVATVMSNMVLEDLLAEEGIKVFRCGVGDRYVLDTMRKNDCRLGGEQSGHIIALDHANTGDGLCSGALFLKAVEDLNENIATLADRFDRYPQVLTNVRIKDREKLMSSKKLASAVKDSEKKLEGKGRMLLRPSGTEPLLRIFVESRDPLLMENVASYLERTINEIIAEEL